MSARGSEWPISSSVILSTAAAESVKLDTGKRLQNAGVPQNAGFPSNCHNFCLE